MKQSLTDTAAYEFRGKWITDETFFALRPRNVFHRQLETVKEEECPIRNRHVLFRKQFVWDAAVKDAKLYISADDYYKLYINGSFIAQGPAPSYHFRYHYNVIDVTGFLKQGENVIAVHTLYQGLINRVWQSGDNRHGLILDLVVNDSLAVRSDESFKTKQHGAYRETGIAGYDTQFLETYDSRAEEVGFERRDFDDSQWENAKIRLYEDHILTRQNTGVLAFEKRYPIAVQKEGNRIRVDFGSNYVGYLRATAKGKRGEVVTVRCGQELNADQSVRYQLRANCNYEEAWILTEGESNLDWFDYKSFRYAELFLPEGCELTDIYMQVRHYPFALKAKLKPEFTENQDFQQIWELCVHTQKYGVQEVIQDCMEREKGFYVGDGCYTTLTNMILTGDDSMVRKLIDDAFASGMITDGLVTCLNCSFMQEIAEYPLMLVYLVLWHYRFTGDKDYLRHNYTKAVGLLEVYRRDYERDFLLKHLDKWCVVEWPANFRDNYDVDIQEGRVCEEPHVSINAYYMEAVKTVNKIASILGVDAYREEQPLLAAFYRAFYDADAQLFRDGVHTNHISLVGNLFPFAFELCPNDICREKIMQMLLERGISAVSLFGSFLALMGLVRCDRFDLVKEMLGDRGAWLRMLEEGATTTFEGWGRDTKWNTSLFHLTMSYAAVFMADIDHKGLFA